MRKTLAENINKAGICVKDDYIFSLTEQILPPVNSGILPDKVQISAGHVEVVGENGVVPKKTNSGSTRARFY